MTNDPVDAADPAGSTDPADPGDTAEGAGFPPPEGTGGSATQFGLRTGGYAARFGLVRPLQGRYLAGVCAALGRATNTDPVLWRVALPVLTVLGGLGGLLYILGWLLMPAEGDTASPLESLIGRGHSSTSRGVAMLLAAIAAIALIGGLTNGIGGRYLALAAIVGGLVLFATTRTGPVPPWAPTVPPATVPPDPSAYRPPFAPYGPYAASSGYPSAGPYQTHEFPGLATTTPVVAPPVPVRRRQPTLARRVTLSCVLIAVGVLGALDLANVVSVPAPAYFALALATVGLGMIVGSFFGRVRGPVTLGILLIVGLLASTAIGGFHHDRYSTGNVVWQPTSLAELRNGYSEGSGQLTVDLRGIDFTGVSRTVAITVNVGKAVVILPPDVDATVDARVSVGNTSAFGKNRGGINSSPWVITDDGTDGPGGGSVRINAKVNIGNVEVRR